MTTLEILRKAGEDVGALNLGYTCESPLEAAVTLKNERQAHICQCSGGFTVRCGVSVCVCTADQFEAVLRAIGEMPNPMASMFNPFRAI